MIYLILFIIYLLIAIYLFFKNKKKNEKNNEKNKKNYDKFFSIFVFIFSFIMLLEYFVIGNPNNNQLYSILLFFSLYLFVIVPNLFFFKLFDNYFIKSKFIYLIGTIFTFVTMFLLYTLNNYNLTSGLTENNIIQWSSLSVLIQNHIISFFMFIFIAFFMIFLLFINLLSTEAFFKTPIRYGFFILSVFVSSFIIYFLEVKESGIFNQLFAMKNYTNRFIPLTIFISSFSSIISLLGL